MIIVMASTSEEWFSKFNLEYLLGSRNAQKNIKTPAICNGWPCRSIWILCFPPRFWIFYPFWKFGWRCYLVGRYFVIYFSKSFAPTKASRKKITQQNKKILLKAKSKILSKRVKDFKNVQIWTKLTDFLQIQTSKPFTTCIKIYPMQVVSKRSYTTIIPHYCTVRTGNNVLFFPQKWKKLTLVARFMKQIEEICPEILSETWKSSHLDQFPTNNPF